MTPSDARKHLAALPAVAAAALAPALDRVAEAVAAEARRQLGAGGAPADAIGALADAITSGHDDEGRASVTVAAPFAADLEYGTRRGPARPFLRPAFASTGDAARKILRGALQSAVAREAP